MSRRFIIQRDQVPSDSFRVRQVRGMFGMPEEHTPPAPLVAELPTLAESWQIGAIVGPSGSGKSSLARAAFAAHYPQPITWPAGQAVIDAFGPGPVLPLTQLLTAVGLGSPPAWLRPFGQLSTGEQFRCQLARRIADALAGGESQPLVVLDEFTSTLDRRTAEIVSISLAKAIRAGTIPVRFVAVTCHRDAVLALEPDWTLDTGVRPPERSLRAVGSDDDSLTGEQPRTAELSWRRLRRRRLSFEVRRCPQRLWRRFAPHHYLSGALSRGATCFAALWEGEPVAFCAVVSQLGKPGWKRISRLVTLPDRQGIGLGLRLAETVAGDYLSRGCALRLTTSHPGLSAALARSERWSYVSRRAMSSKSPQHVGLREVASSAGRGVQTFAYLGGKPVVASAA